MSGIFGAVLSSPDESAALIVDRLMGGSIHQSWLRLARVDSRSYSVGSLSPGTTRRIIETPRIVLAMQGEIFDDVGIASGPKKAREHGVPIEDLAAVFLRRGIDALCGLNGVYALAVHEKERGTVTLVSDRNGFSHLYYWHGGNQLVFAGEWASLLSCSRISRDIDFDTVGDILTVGYPLSDRTLFCSVRLLPAATVLTFDNGSLSSRKYWDYQFGEEHATGDLRTAGFEAWEVIGRSVLARVSPRLCVAITGGLDSRTVAGALRHFSPGTAVVTDTIGPAASADVRFGRENARRLGFPHTHHELGSDYIARYGPEIVRRLGGEASCHTAWALAQDVILRELGLPVLMTGFLGDCLSGKHLPPPVAEMRNSDEALAYIYAHNFATLFSQEQLQELLQPRVFARIAGSAYGTIADTFLQAPTDSLLHRFDYVDLCQRQRRFIATHITLHEALVPVRNPFADNALADFFLHLPLTFRLRQRAYLDMITRFLPDLARVPRSSDGLPLAATHVQRSCAHALARWRRANWKVRRALGLGAADGFHTRECFDHGAALRTGSRTYVTHILATSTILPTLVNRRALDTLLARHMSGRENLYRQICALVTLAEAFNEFGE